MYLLPVMRASLKCIIYITVNDNVIKTLKKIIVIVEIFTENEHKRCVA